MRGLTSGPGGGSQVWTAGYLRGRVAVSPYVGGPVRLRRDERGLGYTSGRGFAGRALGPRTIRLHALQPSASSGVRGRSVSRPFRHCAAGRLERELFLLGRCGKSTIRFSRSSSASFGSKHANGHVALLFYFGVGVRARF